MKPKKISKRKNSKLTKQIDPKDLASRSQKLYMRRLKIPFDVLITKETATHRITAFLKNRKDNKPQKNKRKILKEKSVKRKELKLKEIKKLEEQPILKSNPSKPKVILRKRSVSINDYIVCTF